MNIRHNKKIDSLWLKNKIDDTLNILMILLTQIKNIKQNQFI